MKNLRIKFIGICIFISIILSACGSKSFVLNEITKIELMNGLNGDFIEIIEPEEIETIIQFFVGESFKKIESSSRSTGWGYRVRIYRNGKQIEDITIMTKNRISYGGYFYEITNDNIDTNYLSELFTKKQ